MSAAQSASSDLGRVLVGASGSNAIIDICRLLSRGADVNYVTKDIHEGVEGGMPSGGRAALHAACAAGHAHVTELLVSKGGNVNVRSKEGQTPLHIAAQRGHMEAAIFLLDHGADLAANDNVGCSPLMLAASYGHLYVVKLLVKKGANVHQADQLGLAPIENAAIHGHQEIVDYLISKEAHFEAGGTPAKACKCCGAAGVSLMKCSGCGTVFYCSPECQSKDWKEGGGSSHKVQCKRLVEIKERYVEKAKKDMAEVMADFRALFSNAGNSEEEAGPSDS